jgi:GNAT superfamily N-acetyltransferase
VTNIVGYLLAFTHQTFLANGPVTWIEEVMVAEEVRRRGIGHNLMVAAENWSASKGAAYVSKSIRLLPRPRIHRIGQLLARVASLAFQILSCLRQPDHAMYDSERTLRGWLSDAGAQSLAVSLPTGPFLGEAPIKGTPRWLVGS